MLLHRFGYAAENAREKSWGFAYHFGVGASLPEVPTAFIGLAISIPTARRRTDLMLAGTLLFTVGCALANQLCGIGSSIGGVS